VESAVVARVPAQTFSILVKRLCQLFHQRPS
jgi:hypothetical protein